MSKAKQYLVKLYVSGTWSLVELGTRTAMWQESRNVLAAAKYKWRVKQFNRGFRRPPKSGLVRSGSKEVTVYVREVFVDPVQSNKDNAYLSLLCIYHMCSLAQYLH